MHAVLRLLGLALLFFGQGRVGVLQVYELTHSHGGTEAALHQKVLDSHSTLASPSDEHTHSVAVAQPNADDSLKSQPPQADSDFARQVCLIISCRSSQVDGGHKASVQTHFANAPPGSDGSRAPPFLTD